MKLENNLRERLFSLRVWFCNFHRDCLRLLRSHVSHLGQRALHRDQCVPCTIVSNNQPLVPMFWVSSAAFLDVKLRGLDLEQRVMRFIPKIME